MDMRTWWPTATHEEKAALAEQAGTTPSYLLQIAGGHRQPGHALARRLEEASGIVTPDRPLPRGHLRPDLWGVHV